MKGAEFGTFFPIDVLTQNITDENQLKMLMNHALIR